MKTNKSKLLLCSIALLLLWACSDKIVEKPFIAPPFSAIDKEYTEFTFDAEKGDTLLFTSGSRIIVPPDIWVDTAGNKITGEIKLKYREFSNAKDVFLAGIPLAYDSAGKKETLVTAGMFEIRSFKDSTELNIADNKKLTVQMASYESDADYNFYYLDEKGKNWKYIGYDKPTENPKIQEIKDTIEQMQPETPFPFNDDYFALSYDAILDVYFKDNYYKIEKNYKSKLPKRKAETYGLSWSGIYCGYQLTFNRVRYEAYQMIWKNLSGKKLPWIAKGSYVEKFVYLGDNTYSMTLRKKDKKAYIKVKAIMPIKHLFAYPPETWQEKYDEVMAKIKEEENRLATQFAVYRTFDVSTTGTHNWDKVYNRQDKVIVKAEFKFDKQLEEELSEPDIYYFVENNKSFIKIPFSQRDSLMLVPDSTAKFIAVLSDKEAAVFSSKEHNKIDFDKLRTTPSYSFAMKTVAINSIEDFNKIADIN